MRISMRSLALITAGDVALVTGVLGLAGLVRLSATAGVVLLALGIVLNGLGIGQIVRAARQHDG
jgi:hypothetical protein